MLLSFVAFLTIASFMLLASIVAAQMIVRSFGIADFEVLSDHGFEILTVGVFGQIMGVIYLIVKSLWSEREFEVIDKND